MAGPLIVFSTRETNGRFVVGLAILTALVFAWFSIRWQLGSMLAELTLPNDPTAKSTSEVARSFSPNDPLAAWLYADSNVDLFTPGLIDSSIHAFENVVRLSPNDYRWWIELGRTEERAGQTEPAEMAFRRAIALAPAYAYPSWQFGNFLLRQGRTEESFAALRKSTENNLTYREQVFSLAWDYFDHDPARLESLAADTPDVRVSLALFYAGHGEATDSLRVWNTLNDEQKAENFQIAKVIAQALTEKKFFREGLEFSRQVGFDLEAQPETITNGGFEKAIGFPEGSRYGWNIDRTDNKLDINPDSTVKHQGGRSLKMNFRIYVKPELANPWQVVASEPGGSYTLHFWVRTENLRSAGMPVVQIIDPADYSLIAVSDPVSTGTNDWQEMNIDFKSPIDSDGFVVRVARAYCGDACPIVGLLWLDDLSLVKK